jgi:hypothetical protein
MQKDFIENQNKWSSILRVLFCLGDHKRKTMHKQDKDQHICEHSCVQTDHNQ